MAFSSELYQQIILDHNKTPRNFKVLEDATHQCNGHNPLCGDNITVYVKMNPEKVVEDVSFQGSGCAISKASSSIMTGFAKGKSVPELETVFQEFHQMVKGEGDVLKGENHLGKLSLFEGVKEYPARVKCATLAWHALMGAFQNESKTSTEAEGNKESSEDDIALTLNLTGVKCPINFVKTKVQLSKMSVGEKLKVILDDGDPIKNVPESLKAEGQKVLSQQQLENGQHAIIVEKSH